MFRVSISFVWVILACGVFITSLVIGNMYVLGMHRHPAEPYLYVSDVREEDGRRALVKYGCGGCHVIPGVPGATGRVGPKLEDIKNQMFVAGVLANTPENMARWIREPQTVSPLTAMPNLGVTEEEARQMVSYLLRY